MQVPAKAENVSAAERPAKRMRLSTSVKIADPVPTQAGGRRQQSSMPVRKKVPEGSKKGETELAHLPPEMQRVMQAEGHVAPTPVQQRQAPLHAEVDSPVLLLDGKRAENACCHPNVTWGLA